MMSPLFAAQVAERVQMLFNNDFRSCQFSRPLPSMKLGDRTIGPFDAGSRAELPNWMIDILIRNGVVELMPEDALESSMRVNSANDREKREPALQSVWPYLYSALRSKMHRLSRDASEMDPKTHSDLQTTKKNFESLLENRLTKILRVAKSGFYQDKLKLMTYEEQWLCKSIADVITRWRVAVLSSRP